MTVLIRTLTSSPVLRFLLAGGLAAAVNWFVRFPLSAVMPFAAAVVTAQVVGWFVGFSLYRSFVFAPSGQSLRREIALFVVVNLASLVGVLATALALSHGLQGLGFSTALAEAVGHGAGIAVGAVLNFVGHRALTFAGTGATVLD